MGFPSISEILCTHPLYKSINLVGQDAALRKFIRFNGTVDSYCVECGRDGVFNVAFPDITSINMINGSPTNFKTLSEAFDGEYFTSKLECSRDKDHYIVLLFYLSQQKLIKIGQYPTLVNLNASKMDKYNKILPKEKLDEFSAAQLLAAHGFGIGSFVYLRRVIEYLIEDAHNQARKEKGWDEGKYKNASMGDRISLLANFFPESVVQAKHIYHILSKGVHTLQEKECLDIFDVLNVSTEIILDAKVQKREEEIKTQRMFTELSKTRGRV